MADKHVVTRSITIAAPPSDVYAHLEDFRRWQAWSPWEGLDPDVQRTYTGPASGPGAKYAWKGNRKVGEGSMEIVSAAPPSGLRIDLRFLKPFKSTADTRFAIDPRADGSSVTWSMESDKTLMTKIMGIFKSMDALIGPDFEKGLAQLKEAVEAGA